MGDCVVEEEIPPEMQDDFIQGAIPNFSGPHNEAPRIDWDECWAKEESHLKHHIGEPTHLALVCHDFPSHYRLIEDHLNLIFEMRQDMDDQLHNQHALDKCLDMLFDSLSRDHAKSQFPTCCQPFSFTVRHDGSPSSPHI